MLDPAPGHALPAHLRHLLAPLLKLAVVLFNKLLQERWTGGGQAAQGEPQGEPPTGPRGLVTAAQSSAFHSAPTLGAPAALASSLGHRAGLLPPWAPALLVAPKRVWGILGPLQQDPAGSSSTSRVHTLPNARQPQAVLGKGRQGKSSLPDPRGLKPTSATQTVVRVCAEPGGLGAPAKGGRQAGRLAAKLSPWGRAQSRRPGKGSLQNWVGLPAASPGISTRSDFSRICSLYTSI